MPVRDLHMNAMRLTPALLAAALMLAALARTSNT
jgi:hypothetical protein